MSVALAFQVDTPAEDALRLAAEEARHRQTQLAVVHVVETLDDTIIEQHRTGIAERIQRSLDESGLGDLDWQLHVQTEDRAVAQAVIDCVGELGADLLVIGMRHRSPVGTLVFGSITQTLLLGSPVPVLVATPAWISS